MNDFTVERQRDPLRVVNQTVHVFLGNLVFRPADCHDSATLKALDVVPRNSDRDGAYLDSGLRLGLLDGCLNRANGLFDIRDHPPYQTVRLASSDSKNLELPRIRFVGRRDDGTHFRGTDV